MAGYGGNPTGSLKDLLIASTTGGFGLSMGRDMYKNLKKNIGLVIVAIVVTGGTAYGVWNLVRGHKHPSILRLIGCLLLIAVSITASIFLATFIVGAAEDGTQNMTGAVVLALCFQAMVILVSAIVGLIHRMGRAKAFAVERHNEQFLSENGLRDVGGRDQTMLDSAGNELKLDDIRADAITFKVSGRRGVRAKIELDNTGRMLNYVAP